MNRIKIYSKKYSLGTEKQSKKSYLSCSPINTILDNNLNSSFDKHKKKQIEIN
jgi:hypothetical protein